MTLRRFFDRLRGRESGATKRSPRADATLASLGSTVRSRIVGTDSLAFAPPGHPLRVLGELERQLEEVSRSCQELSTGNDALAARTRDIGAQIEASFGPQGEVRSLLEFWPASWELAAPRVPSLMARLTRLHASALDIRDVARLRQLFHSRARALREQYARTATAAVDALLSEASVDQAVERMRSLDECDRAFRRLGLLDESFADITAETNASLRILARIASEQHPLADAERAGQLAAFRDGYLRGHWQRLMHLEEQEQRRANSLLGLLRRPNTRSMAVRSRSLLGGVQEGALERWLLLYLAGHKADTTRRS